jgi:hypothetical protein
MEAFSVLHFVKLNDYIGIYLNSHTISQDIYVRFKKGFDPVVIRETRAHNGIEILPLQPICNHLMTFKGYLGFKNQNLCHLHTNYGF